ncbi:MAG: hypothetical protein K2K74_10680 [Lachnospiraceae bacterium]|nr:hypothetical protein [Lachnospiraceae bacterium]
MRINKLAGIVLAAALTVCNSATALAGLQANKIEISSQIGDNGPERFFGDTHVEFVFEEYDPVTTLIPVYQNVSRWMGEEYNEASLLFLSVAAAETAIPANADWLLVSGFQNGQAFVKEKSTGHLVRIDMTGTETGRFLINEEITALYRLPASSQYAFYYITGKTGGSTWAPENLKVVFVAESGAQKVVNLQGNYWNTGDFAANGYMPLFKMTGTYTTQWKIEGSDHWNDLDHYNMEQMDYLDVNGEIHQGAMPAYQQEAEKEYIPEPYDIGLPLDRTTSIYTYTGGNYDLKRVDNVSGLGDIYEIYDKAGNATGVKICSIAFGAENFVIARSIDPNYDYKKYPVDDSLYTAPYCIYYIGDTLD